jgi:hypothetical protein
MNYQRIYDQIIDRAKTRKLEGYKEKHHIIPKCLGGSNEKENLVELTAREHFICHLLLCKIYPENINLTFALWAMVNMRTSSQERVKVSSTLYEEIKQKHSKLKSELYKGRKQPKEVIEKRMLKQYGRACKPETRAKISAAAMGHSRNKGRITSASTREKIGASKRGRSIATKGISKPQVNCPYCNKIGGIPQMKRWHFENCKKKLDSI